tara:strand:+ start:2153 stop:3364 length:1212 start_codon:yes stop_codon:yes gene_type:complete
VFRNKEHPKRFKEKIFPSHFNVDKMNKSKLCWFHVASIGELNSILPIIEELNSNNDFEFLITTTTLSSSKLADNEFIKLENIKHRFFPLDVNFLVSRFLSSWKPDLVFLVDSEIWPNLILQIKRKKIPLALINARITSKTFKRWNFFSNAATEIFSSFSMCLTSNLESKQYLEKFKVKNIYHHGNIKLLSKIDLDKISNTNDDFLSNNKFWFAASTHRGEENLCLNTHLKLKREIKEITTIIAPRHIERTNEIKKLCENLNLNYQILNENEVIQRNKEIIIINSFGKLNNFFRFAKSVFIGKSTLIKLENESGQNPIDAVKLGCKVYHGPYVYNFKEVYQILKKKNVAKQIVNATELSENLARDLKDNNDKKSNISDFINDLSKKTFSCTMKDINNFLFYADK